VPSQSVMYRCQALIARQRWRHSCHLQQRSASLLQASHFRHQEDGESTTRRPQLIQLPMTPTYGTLKNYNSTYAARNNSNIQVRAMSTWLPEALQGINIWGGAGFLLTTIHMDGAIPYWACFSIINILVRTMLFPLTIYSAHTAARFRPVAPDIQFFITLFQRDYQTLRATASHELRFLRQRAWESMKGIYKLNNVNPLAPFLSPILQIPVFVYISTDLRKIVNGRDPELAQALTDCGDSSLFWLSDLTEADPYYALPIFAGVAMYTNVEWALGRRSLAGVATSKADTGVILKDVFQSVAILMPCFSANFPAGMQVYLCTTFIFTFGQNFLLRNERFRQAVGLPSLNAPGEAPKIATQIIELKMLEKKADEIRGDGPLLGRFVLYRNWRLSFPGTYRESTIKVDPNAPRVKTLEHDPVMDIIEYGKDKHKFAPRSFDPKQPFINGISAPYHEMEERKKEAEFEKRIQEVAASDFDVDFGKGKQLTDEQMIELMEKANRGERPVLTKFVEREKQRPVDAAKLNMNRVAGKKNAGKRKLKRKR
jgi:membrane protein insertase Oxa1/YidC/SpoIIIJ